MTGDTTVSTYVKARFAKWAKRYVGIISLSAPTLTAIRMSQQGFSGEMLAAGAVAWAVAVSFALVVILASLTVGGLWQARKGH